MYWIRRPVSPTLQISLSLAAADGVASFLLGFGLFLNSLLPQIIDIQGLDCYQLTLETFRVSSVICSVLHLLALTGNHYLGILKPLQYSSLMTGRNTKIMLLFLWLVPNTFYFVYFTKEGFLYDCESEYASDDWQTHVQELTTEHHFFWGVGTGAYQIEGGWSQDGKGESIWDVYTHKFPHRIIDQSNGDIACDSYNNLERDLKMVSTLNVDYYRISISWSRILPDGGLSDQLNEKGLNYYHRLFDGLLAKNITPMVTIYHWGLPKTLSILGGWQNELIILYFEKYARILFENFGEKVKMWVTVNEPYNICEQGYGEVIYAPEEYVPGVSNYLCMHNLLKAHARVYHLYQNKFKAQQNGLVGYATSFVYTLPYSQDQDDIDSANRGNAFLGWYVDPIFGPNGDYSKTVKENIAMISKLQGLKKSRLPQFTKEEIEYIKGSADFLGINYYTANLARTKKNPALTNPTFEDDMRIMFHKDPNWERTEADWQRIAPEGLKAGLHYIQNYYNNPLTILTEIGCVGAKDADDEQVIKYYKDHIKIVHEHVTKEGGNVRGFLAWSLMDSFEWNFGYSIFFGLYRTNFSDPKRSTSIKKSGEFFRQLNDLSKEARQRKSIKLLEPSELIQNDISSSRSFKEYVAYVKV
ncbi:myrosinase 1-like [Chrysoperla carnea]|uniref:myrosinase 1-like n=1 Tax=Chrysoperla carnea TaxID=189513 RepID=UPI001D07C9E1|nr:myrosinase 1-like [Chrysoperla carnea]